MSAHGMFLASLSQRFFYAKMPTFMLVLIFQKYFSDTLPFLQPELKYRRLQYRLVCGRRFVGKGLLVLTFEKFI